MIDGDLDRAEHEQMVGIVRDGYARLERFIVSSLEYFQWCAATPNVDLFEVDIDDVPWKDDLTTEAPAIEGGILTIPSGVGWGADVNEDVLGEHPWEGDTGAPVHDGTPVPAANAKL